MDYQAVTRLLDLVFHIALIIIIYTYIGYGVLLGLLVAVKKMFVKPPHLSQKAQSVSVIIAAFNEEDWLAKKLENTFSLCYPEELLEVIVITDGSYDRTSQIAKEFAGITHLHSEERRGKIAAVNRAIQHSTGEILLLTDANSMLNTDCIQNIVRHYSNPKVGGVSGEKRIRSPLTHNGTEGEGLYWKYESVLKKLDSDLYTAVGAAGEIFSIRRRLWERLPEDTLIEDFVQSLKLCIKGYVVKYEPDAFAVENPSESVDEEMTRKIRISAGGFQSLGMLKELFNLLKYPVAGFQFISHRVLRWTITPLALLVLLLVNVPLVILSDAFYYQVMMALQFIFYFFAVMGWSKAKKNQSHPLITVPFYFLFMNLAVFIGFKNYILNRQTVLWKKAGRQKDYV